MERPFESATIDCLDDGTFSCHVRYPEKPKKGKEGMVSMMDRGKSFTSETLEGAIAKIKSMSGKKRASLDEYMGREEDTEED